MGLNSSKTRGGLVSEINVTPLVDVMLVLLIIFMVTAPMMTQGLEVDFRKIISLEIYSPNPVPIVFPTADLTL